MTAAGPVLPTEDQASVIAFLSDPRTHGVTDVRRIDTHASIVVLAGERAYKLKRAVRYSYLDYSTIERRELACRAEVTLNRRTAPDIYLGVEPITRGPDNRLSIGGGGRTVDWVVAMRRFDDNKLFDRLAAAGTLTTGLILELAETIARFHAAAEITGTAAGSEVFADLLAGNRSNLDRAVPDILDDDAVRRLDAASRHLLASVGPVLDRRRDAGKVRLCHGDLHLRNICLIDGRPVLFDCIEFNRDIASTDVLYDLAFLLMDLKARGLDALASAAFNRYLDIADETDGLAALALFLATRAAVSAHVHATAAGLKSGRPERAFEVASARTYLSLALTLSQPPSARLVAIGGLSGTGKSTLAYGLSPAIGPAPGARVLRTDVLRKRIFGVASTTRLPDAAYATDVSRAVYRQLLELAARTLAAGCSVIADGVFARPGDREAIAAVAGEQGVPFAGLWLEAPADRLAQRIRARRGDASDATVAVLLRQLDQDVGPIRWRRLDAARPSGELLCHAEKLLHSMQPGLSERLA